MSEIGTGLQNASGIRAAVERAGYAFVEASDMRTALGRFGSLADWTAFAESWNDLEVDTYMGDGGRYRRRRFGVYAAERQGAIVRGAHQPHYQGRDYNTLNGGIERWFKPVTEEIGSGSSMRTILEYCRAPVRPPRTRCEEVARRGPPVPNRGQGPARPASRHPRACIATASTMCWCC